ncbi:MAG TPA: TIGR00730 family Rossman fold protein [Rubrivivax sp.]|nr:TIGR00730 family Rossman fold protein [Rubrivivax sp.]
MTPNPHSPRAGPQPPSRPVSLCVFCGSRSGQRAQFAAAAREVGTRIGQLGWQLVYGGGSTGLMGELADAALAAGARVIGVIPQSLMQRELGHPRLSEQHVVQTMHERKRLMAEHSDAFLALPGGIGTLEELFEVWTWRQLGYHDKPLGLLNTDGYYDKLLAFVAHTTAAGFLGAPHRALLQVDANAEPLLQRLCRLAANATAPDDYSGT